MNGTHVLIVEDREADRTLLRKRLERDGYRVTVARDGLEALAAARRDPPDSIISDVLMPNMDGFALCRAWMQDADLKAIPFIFYSATLTRPEDEQFAMRLGAMRYLTKPMEMEAFLLEVRTVLQQHSGHAASAPASPLDDTTFHALHELALGRTIEDKIAQLEATNEALAQESQRNRILLRSASDGVHILDADGNVLEVSDSFCEMLGYSREELIGANAALWDAQWSPQELKQVIADQLAKEGRSVFETKHRRRDGSIFDVEVTGQSLELEGKPVLFNSARSIVERILSERKLVDSEARFRGLVEQSIAGMYIIQDAKMAYVNPRAAELLGQGSADEMIGTDPLIWVTESDRSTVAELLRRLLVGEVQNVALDFGALRRDGVVIQVGANAARATHEGRPAVIGLLQDISEKKRAEDEIKNYVAQLQTAFMSTVEVATTLGEMRDPYTAGHQRRVAEIAVAIGAELGFDQRRQEGLRVAGYLHDIGKITIPAEILSKPGKLSSIEFQLINAHSQAGYEVLKDVMFPWPVAEVARQHHERMDGSGYPQGLKGEAILIEARIMAVADVIEAMSSHRPYRAGLGIEAALSEIERERGRLYDAEVADAALRLFRKRHYQLAA